MLTTQNSDAHFAMLDRMKVGGCMKEASQETGQFHGLARRAF
jgi:hypothetical protein